MYAPRHFNENDADKLGQNRSAEDRAAVASRLEASGSESDSALARLMKGK